ILRAGETSAHVNVLYRLKEKRGAGNGVEFRAEALDDHVGADLSLVERLELREKPAAVVAASSACEGNDRVDGGILANEVREILDFHAHGAEGNVLVGLDKAGYAADVLLREKSFGSEDV